MLPAHVLSCVEIKISRHLSLHLLGSVELAPNRGDAVSVTAPARWREGRRRSLEQKTDSLASTQVLARAARRAPRAAQDTALVPPRRRAGERRCAAPRGTSLGLPRAGHRRRRRRRRGAGRGGAAAPGAVQARARAGG